MTQIACWILDFIGGVISSVFAPFHSTIEDSFSSIGGVSNFIFSLCDYVNFLIPIDVIFGCILAMISFYVLSFTIWLTLYFIDKLAKIIG